MKTTITIRGKNEKMAEKYLKLAPPMIRMPEFDWVMNHNQATVTPKNEEIGILLMLRGLASYADAYEARFQSAIGTDYVLGKAWLESLRAFRTLLNGELGRLDAGTLDKAACELYRAAGFEGEL